jgi:hypothetical protein
MPLMEWLEPPNEKPISSQQRYARVSTIFNYIFKKGPRLVEKVIAVQCFQYKCFYRTCIDRSTLVTAEIKDTLNVTIG